MIDLCRFLYYSWLLYLIYFPHKGISAFAHRFACVYFLWLFKAMNSTKVLFLFLHGLGDLALRHPTFHVSNLMKIISNKELNRW
jgi:hypothetical protein